MRYFNYLWEQFKESSMLIKFTILAIVMIWALAFGLAMFAVILLWESPAVAQPVTPSPVVSSATITLEPKAGTANTPVTISGQGWTPGSTVLIYLTSPDSPMPGMGDLAVESAVVDPNGNFVALVPLLTQPHWEAPGLVRVVARTLEGEIGAQAFFSLTDVAVTPTDTPTGEPEPSNSPTSPSPTATDMVPTATPQPGTPALTTVTDLNVRSGPGTGYAILGLMRAGQSAEVTGVSPDGRWWQIDFSGTSDGRGWVAAQYSNAVNTNNVPVVQAYPDAPTATPQPTATARPQPTPVVITDWRGEYYNNVTMSGDPVLVRNDANIDFNWGKGGPAGSVGSDNFSARWTRSVYFPAGTYRFNVRADDGVLFWIDDRLVIDQWHDSSSAIYTAEVNLTEGNHSLKMAYYERVGDAVAQLWWERRNSYPEWKGEYFNNPNLSGAPVLVRNDSNISFNWGDNAPGTALPTDNFSARWTRDVYFPAGTYRFTVRVDDGVRLWVDGNLVIDQWRDSSINSYSVDVNLSEGAHPIRLEYYDRWYDAIVQLEWQRVESYPDWKAEYFNNRKLQGNPVLVRNDREIDFNWHDDAPASEVPADNFSVRWTRRVNFDDETYLFEVQVDDGVRLWVGDTLVIDSWEDGSVRKLQGRIRLDDGQHRVRVEYYDRTGDAEIEVDWREDDTPANQPPQAIPGGPYTLQEGNQVTFDGRASHDPNGSIVKYEWDLNYDGNSFDVQETGATVTKQYPDGPVSRVIALRVTDNSGVSRVATTGLNVQNVPPAVNINGSYTAQVGSGVTLVGTASDPSPADQSGLAYVWDFGDGNTGTGSVASHIYTQAGNYTARLTVTDKDGGQGSAVTTVQVFRNNQPPQAVIDGPTKGRAGEPVRFNAGKSEDGDGRIVGYGWNFGDGTTANGVEVEHVYQQPGSYEVKLHVKDDQGLTGNTSVVVNIAPPEPVNQPPTAVIDGQQQGIVGQTLTFNGTNSSDSDGKIAGYAWNFGDGTQERGPQVSHTYQKPGDYQVTLTVSDNGGLTRSTSVTVKVEEGANVNLPPMAVLNGPATGAVGQTLTFSGAGSTDSDGKIIGYAWDMGDGTMVEGGEVMTHTYVASGEYKVVLTVKDNTGMIDSIGQVVTVTDQQPVSHGAPVEPKRAQ